MPHKPPVNRATTLDTKDRTIRNHNDLRALVVGQRPDSLLVNLNVGTSVQATDAGDGYIQGGLSLGAYVNPAPGELKASGSIQSATMLIAPSVGPSAAQQHVLPAVPSDTVALLVAPQTMANKTLTSTTAFNAAAGTPPFTVVSPTTVVNLDADMVDTFHAALAPVASTSTIPVSDTLGKLAVAWLPTSLVGGAPGIGLLPLGDATGHLDATWLPATLPGLTVTAPLLFSPDNTVDIGTTLLKPRTVYVGSRVGIGLGTTAPPYSLAVSGTFPGDFVGSLTQVSATAGSACLGLFATATDGASAIATFISGGVLRAKFWADGGVSIGAVANPGAGILNVANGIEKNGSLYNFPDFVLERYYTGTIEKYRGNPGAEGYAGLAPLAAVDAYAREHHHLPRVGEQKDIFDRADVLLEKLEEVFLYLFGHERRLRDLETAAGGSRPWPGRS